MYIYKGPSLYDINGTSGKWRDLEPKGVTKEFAKSQVQNWQ